MANTNRRYRHIRAGPEVKDYANFWKSVKIRFYNPSNGMSKEAYINYPCIVTGKQIGRAHV